MDGPGNLNQLVYSSLLDWVVKYACNLERQVIRMAKKIARTFPRKGYFDVIASGKVRAWRWRYWPSSVELKATMRYSGMSPRDVAFMLLGLGESHMARKVEVTKQGLPNLEPLADGGVWRKELPELTSHLVDPTYDDQSPRKVGKLFLQVERGMWVVTLKDMNQGLILEVTVERPEQAMQALEAALKQPQPPWRVDPWARPQANRRKK